MLGSYRFAVQVAALIVVLLALSFGAQTSLECCP
jgi:hypothetical protein